MIKAVINEIIDHGWTYEIHATINDVPRAFFDVAPTEENIKMHIQKQWEMIERCIRTHDEHKDSYTAMVGKEFVV